MNKTLIPVPGKMEVITFDQLPAAVSRLLNKMENLERLLLEKQTSLPLEVDPDCWMDINQLCNYHPDHPKKPTVYEWVHNDLIPYHKGQKKLRFLKSEIDEWMKSNRKTPGEIVSERDIYLSKLKKNSASQQGGALV